MVLLKNGFKNTSTVFKIMYLVKAVMILVLCRVHDFTRYKVWLLPRIHTDYK